MFIIMAHYIDKDRVVAEIEKLYDGDYKYLPSDSAESVADFKDDLLMTLDTLEAKDVDLEKEVKSLIKSSVWRFADKEDFLRVAKHFFELGLSVNNPITAADRRIAEEIILSLKQVENDYHIDHTKEMEWVRNQVKKG